MRGHVFESLTLIKINKLIINIYIKKKHLARSKKENLNF